jgi:hypothetical protein
MSIQTVAHYGFLRKPGALAGGENLSVAIASQKKPIYEMGHFF